MKIYLTENSLARKRQARIGYFLGWWLAVAVLRLNPMALIRREIRKGGNPWLNR